MLAGVKCQHCGNLKRSLNVIGKDARPSSFVLHLFFLFLHHSFAFSCFSLFLAPPNVSLMPHVHLVSVLQSYFSLFGAGWQLYGLDDLGVEPNDVFAMLCKSPARFTLAY